MTPDELMTEACRLAKESVDNNWGGPFGAVIVQDGEIIARGQNRVLLTGDITADAEIETIRKAVAFLNPQALSISTEYLNESTLELVPSTRRLAGPRSCGRSGRCRSHVVGLRLRRRGTRRAVRRAARDRPLQVCDRDRAGRRRDGSVPRREAPGRANRSPLPE